MEKRKKGFLAENLKNLGVTFHDAPTFPLLLYQTPFIMGAPTVISNGNFKLVLLVSSIFL